RGGGPGDIGGRGSGGSAAPHRPRPPDSGGLHPVDRHAGTRVREIAIARNYAETLVALAAEHDALEKWGPRLDVVAAAMSTPSIEVVLMSPRVPREREVRLLTEALLDYPRPFS